MTDYETIKAEGEKYGIPNITPEEFERNKNFTSLITILTRIKNERGDVAKRIIKQNKIEKELRPQPEPEMHSMPVRTGPEKCALFAKMKKHCDRLGFSCEANCVARVGNSIFCIEGLTVGIGCDVHTKAEKPRQGGIFGW
jgi:hypothetical protein